MKRHRLLLVPISIVMALIAILFFRFLVVVAIQESASNPDANELLPRSNQHFYSSFANNSSQELYGPVSNSTSAHNYVARTSLPQDDNVQTNTSGLHTLTTEPIAIVSVKPETYNNPPHLEQLEKSDSNLEQPLGSLAPHGTAANCVVTSTSDSGTGTLRECLINSTAGDSVTFDISTFPPGTPTTINLTSSLPIISVDNLIIDASDAGVILDGGSLTSGSGLVISGTTGVKIRGLQITNFPGHGILVFSEATNNTIGGNRNVGSGPLGQGNLIHGMLSSGTAGILIWGSGTTDNTVSGNFVGTNVSGTQSLSNNIGITIGEGATNNLIGGVDEGANNLVSGNSVAGISLQDNGTTGNQIVGNFVGTDISGTASISNTLTGILIQSGASENIVGGTQTGEGNLISGNGNAGIQLRDSDTTNNSLLGNLIGTNITGTQALPNGTDGVVVAFGAANNIVGGNTAGARNIISGNLRNGVLIRDVGGSNNQVLGNYIGTDVNGGYRVPNGVDGIIVSLGATDNVIGGESAGAGNVISGNNDEGIQIDENGTTGNQVLGNLIGTNATGSEPLGNLDWGVAIQSGAAGNVVGGTTPQAKNVISGNGEDGLTLQGQFTTGNLIQGNFIGTNISGTLSLGNSSWGISIAFGASSNVIGGESADARNLISGNEGPGITIQGSGTDGNTVLGNFIGTDIDGLSSLPNADGIGIAGGAQNNVIGGTVPGARNVISGNRDNGVQIEDMDTTDNLVIGNFIGTDKSGTMSLANNDGVAIIEGASANVIGGSSEDERNLLSGNLSSGVSLEGDSTTGNRVIGNYIGTDVTGENAIPNVKYGVFLGFGASSNFIGGTGSGERNVISGNGGQGVFLQNSGTDNNEILGNYIGTDPSGAGALANERDGVVIAFEASNNIIGGESPGSQNVISGNGRGGIFIQDVGTTGNKVVGNLVGTDNTGSFSVPNGTDGITISRASENVIGGQSQNARNLVSGNTEDGIQLQHSTAVSNTVIGNYIGTDISGNQALPNLHDGVVFWDEANNNILGGLNAGERNLISGNSNLGVSIAGIGTMSNKLIGNYIGTDSTGTRAIPNLIGVVIGFGATNNIVGGLEPGSLNLISGNSADGIVLHREGTEENHVIGNMIGSDLTGSNPLSNGEHGIRIENNASYNTIGISNTISYNGGAGIKIDGVDCVGNTVTRNIIYGNVGLPIEFSTLDPTPPHITRFISETNTIEGIACANCLVEIFSNPTITPAANIYLGDTTADGNGNFFFVLPSNDSHRFVSLNTTDENGTTTEFVSVDLQTKYIYLPLVIREE